MLRGPLLVTRPDDLGPLIGRIHDESFCLKDAEFAKEQGTVTVPYRRRWHGGPWRLVRDRFLWRTYEGDLIRSELTIRNVVEYAVDDRSRIGTYSFNNVTFAGSALVIECNEDCELRLTIGRLEIESRDLELSGKALVTRGIWGLSWSSNACE